MQPLVFITGASSGIGKALMIGSVLLVLIVELLNSAVEAAEHAETGHEHDCVLAAGVSSDDVGWHLDHRPSHHADIRQLDPSHRPERSAQEIDCLGRADIQTVSYRRDTGDVRFKHHERAGLVDVVVQVQLGGPQGFARGKVDAPVEVSKVVRVGRSAEQLAAHSGHVVGRVHHR